MASLIAIGYPDEATAATAAAETERAASSLVIEPDCIAVVRRDREGGFHVTTNHHLSGAGASWGVLWSLLFSLLFFVPVFGMEVGAGLRVLMSKVQKAGIDRKFQDQARDMVQPGSSALFLVVEHVTPDKVVDALSQYGGTVLTSSMSLEAEAELLKELHGAAATV